MDKFQKFLNIGSEMAPYYVFDFSLIRPWEVLICGYLPLLDGTQPNFVVFTISPVN